MQTRLICLWEGSPCTTLLTSMFFTASWCHSWVYSGVCNISSMWYDNPYPCTSMNLNGLRLPTFWRSHKLLKMVRGIKSLIELRPACLACNVTRFFVVTRRHMSMSTCPVLEESKCSPCERQGRNFRCFMCFVGFSVSSVSAWSNFVEQKESHTMLQVATSALEYHSITGQKMSARIFHIGCLKS